LVVLPLVDFVPLCLRIVFGPVTVIFDQYAAQDLER
jgi:hypothetical protein